MVVHSNPGSIVWPATMIVWGPGFTTAAHRHHCFQLIMVMHGTLLVRGGFKDAWMKCGAVLVRPEVAHEIDARDSTVLIAFVDPESELGTALVDRLEATSTLFQTAKLHAGALGRTPTEARVGTSVGSFPANPLVTAESLRGPRGTDLLSDFPKTARSSDLVDPIRLRCIKRNGNNSITLGLCFVSFAVSRARSSLEFRRRGSRHVLLVRHRFAVPRGQRAD